MSLDIARNIAFSGLWATQVQISVASANIANADTKGYTEKTANQASSITSRGRYRRHRHRHQQHRRQAVAEIADRCQLRPRLGRHRQQLSDRARAALWQYREFQQCDDGHVACEHAGGVRVGPDVARERPEQRIAAVSRPSARSATWRRNCGRRRAVSKRCAPVPIRIFPHLSRASTLI